MKGWSRSHLAKHNVSAAQFQALRIQAETGTPIADFLREVYVVQRLSTPDIFDRYGITYRRLKELLIANDIPLRTHSESVANQWTRDDGRRRAATARKMEDTNRRVLALRGNVAKRHDVRRKISAVKKANNPGLMPMLLTLRQWRLDNPTGAESTMIDALDAAGLVYEREFQVGRYFLDFAFVACQVGIEVDGVGWHSRDKNTTSDAARDAWLASQGWRIFRYNTRQVGQDAAGCIQDVISKLHVLGIDPPAVK
jgi:very-short-patch-repair endonuclease